jgi:hypothetical protein
VDGAAYTARVLTALTWPTVDGWYDVTVTADDGTHFAHRFAGHLEP